MIDPMNIQLAQTLSDERLKCAEQARRQKSWVAGPRLIDRLRMAIGARAIALGRRLQASATAGKTAHRPDASVSR